ncbi:hypothetical protein Dda_2176 [Drechslerella dactyloides]|uniref:Uncharacterized protein n=1 Tax=Drechslerella dactyloides TaxID=74499 RepID=A0AAD6J314_DREDA|nr:hypothetical protein Dda_2176 [Drechslerella dactyloides]
MQKSLITIIFSTLALRAYAACPATPNHQCQYWCDYPGTAAAGSCSNVNITTQGSVCNVCPGITVACPAKYDAECPYLCHYPAVPQDGFSCSYVNITTQGSVCEKCPGGPAGTSVGLPSPSPTSTASGSASASASAVPSGCPATPAATCAYWCEYGGQPDTGTCEAALVVNLRKTCQKCPGGSGTSTVTPPPIATGAASTLRIGGAAVIGLLGLALLI